ncbi:MAG: autotransporter-associated beta strand repeat-containing protein, partial [Prosthecobacter sp.]|nr:autotransporter-associated beta strand repeat-containing protein [Prosthecobacter sp.]
LHPGSLLLFQDAQAGGNRWDDSTPVNLDGSALQVEGTNNLNLSSETVGALNFDRGARIYLNSEGTSDAIFTAASVSRAPMGLGAGTGRGTLVFTPAAANRLGISNTSNNAEQAIFTAAPTASGTAGVAGMLPGYYIDGQAHRFVTHGANGISPVADGSMVGFSTGMTGGTAVVNLTAATTLPDFNPEIFALRGGNFALNSPTGANNDATITFGGSGDDVGSVISYASTFTINPNLTFGATGTNEALFYAGGNIRVNGNITAGAVTKFGAGTLEIGNDQSDAARGVGQGYGNGWVLNEGNLNLLTFGSAGNAVASNTIVLNGNRATTTSVLYLRAPSTDSLLNYTYTSGRIIAVDNATIDWDPGADDRVHTIADIEIQQSGGIGNGTMDGTNDAQLRVANNRNRSILAAGQLTITNNAILNVDATSGPTSFYSYANHSGYLTTGTSAGMSVASLNGSARLTKWGDGYLYIRGDSSSTFSGTFVLDQGSVYVTHNGSLGTGPVTVNRYGALDIGVANYVPTNSSLTYNEGSIERWSVNGARTGAIELGLATLQVAADQTGTVAVTLQGGSIEGWLRSDDITETERHAGVFRNLGPNVSVTLAANSFVGSQYYLGANGLNNGQQINDYRPAEEFAGSGVILNVKGVISESGGPQTLTKVGYDTVILSGQNTYTGGTVVSGGKLMLGTADALAPVGNLTTHANGVLDLNGNDQTVAELNNPITPTTAGVASGFVTNSSTTVHKLTVGNGVVAPFAYSGLIQHNIALTKIGGGIMTLNAANTYVGNTTISAGGLTLGAAGSIDDSPWLNIAGAGSAFDVSARTSYTFDGRISGGGTDAAGTTYATVTNAARINGNVIVGDHVGEISLIGTMAPGGNSVADSIATAGDLIGHLYTNGDLTLSGQLDGTAATTVNRLTLQLNGATSNLAALGYTSGTYEDFVDGLSSGTTLQQEVLNGAQGNLAGHDYINVAGDLTINQYGRIAVTDLGAYNPGFGDLFNLLDWTTLTSNAFDAGTRYQDGTENFDLELPTLAPDLLWDTSLFISHGVIIVVPEPTRILLLFIGLLAAFSRRRRSRVWS